MPELIPQSAAQATAKVFLEMRRSLAESTFLRRYIYTEESTRFLGSPYKYGIHLSGRLQEKDLINLLCSNAPAETISCLKKFLSRYLVPSLPEEFLTAVEVPTTLPADQAGDRSRALAAHAIATELPASLPYAYYFGILTRLAARCDSNYAAPPRQEEFSAYLGHCHRNTMVKARHRHPSLWDEARGHYVIDSRGSAFAIQCVQQLGERRLLQPGTRFLDIGSGIGTMLAAVHYFSPAHVTGIEQHRGLNQLAHALLHKLSRLRGLDPSRLTLKTGNAFYPEVIDLTRYDVCYVYSPLGIDVITADAVLDRLRVGAILISNRRPRRFRDQVELLPDVGGVGVYRKLAC
ncbi:MAG: class I SAM-dependent methyltransferase [Planctomycetota bacterium]|nr:class I SAM-dependent methyltransferase [Planctomycetota bacterium]